MRTGLGSTFIVLSVFLGAVWGCGSDSGSSSGDEAAALQDCKDVCKKEVSCTPGFTLDCDKLCTPSNSGQPTSGAGGGAPTSCDFSAYHSKAQECSKADCGALPMCLSDLGKVCGG